MRVTKESCSTPRQKKSRHKFCIGTVKSGFQIKVYQ